MRLHGWISTFWEQGMEEMPWLIFQDEQFVGPQPGSWSREGIHQLYHGDKLTIYAPDGAVLWSDRLRTRRKGFFGKLHAGAHDWFPLEVGPETWNAWFNTQPPLRAELMRGGGLE